MAATIFWIVMEAMWSRYVRGFFLLYESQTIRIVASIVSCLESRNSKRRSEADVSCFPSCREAVLRNKFCETGSSLVEGSGQKQVFYSGFVTNVILG